MDYEGSPIIGAGGYGIVLDLGNGHREAIKLFKHVEGFTGVITQNIPKCNYYKYIHSDDRQYMGTISKRGGCSL